MNENTRLKYRLIGLVVVLVAAFAVLPFSLGGFAVFAENSTANGNAIFTKWISSAGTAPVVFNMAGVVSGDVGGGKFVGEVLSLDTSAPGTTKIHALYHVNGGTHQFTADIRATQHDAKGTAVINGTVTEGWLQGARIQGEYQLIRGEV